MGAPGTGCVRPRFARRRPALRVSRRRPHARHGGGAQSRPAGCVAVVGPRGVRVGPGRGCHGQPSTPRAPGLRRATPWGTAPPVPRNGVGSSCWRRLACVHVRVPCLERGAAVAWQPHDSGGAAEPRDVVPQRPGILRACGKQGCHRSKRAVGCGLGGACRVVQGAVRLPGRRGGVGGWPGCHGRCLPPRAQ